MSSFYSKIAPAHRAIWRTGLIIAPLGLATDAAFKSGGHRISFLVVLILMFYTGIGIRDIIAEYRDPKPSEAGFAGKNFGWVLLIAALVVSVIWLALYRQEIATEWPWLLLMYLAYALAYVLRPRLSKKA